MSWRKKSYDVLPALAVRGKALRQSLRLVTIGWMWGVVWMTCVSGDQMRAFAKMLGFNDFAFGVFGAIPFIATLAQLPAAIVVERTGLRKYMFMDAGVVGRLLWIPVALIPFVFDLGRDGSLAAVIVMLSIVAVSNFLANFATPPWMTWMADLVPRRIRGRFFARRAQLTPAVQVIVITVISVILVALSGGTHGQENAVDQRTLLHAISVIFLIAAIFGAMDILTFRSVREIFQTRNVPHAVPAFDFNVRRGKGVLAGASYPARYVGCAAWELLIEPLKTNRVFRNYVCYGSAITFSATVSGWYYWLQCREVLGFNSLATNALFMVIGPVSAIATAGWWGKLIDRYGRRPVLFLATIGTLLSVVPFFFATPHTPSPMFVADAVNWCSIHLGRLLAGAEWVVLDASASQLVGAYLLAASGCLVGGSSWAGVGLAQNAIILGFSDGTGRSKYVAASAFLVNLGGAAGGVVGGIVAQKFSGLYLLAGPILLNNYTLTFAVNVAVRMGSLLWLRNMPDPGARTVRDLMRYWGENTYNIVVSRLFYPLRIIGWGRHDDAGKRRDD